MMKTFIWTWNKFLVGVALDKMPMPRLTQRIRGFRNVWILAIHLGFFTIITEVYECMDPNDSHTTNNP